MLIPRWVGRLVIAAGSANETAAFPHALRGPGRGLTPRGILGARGQKDRPADWFHIGLIPWGRLSATSRAPAIESP